MPALGHLLLLALALGIPACGPEESSTRGNQGTALVFDVPGGGELLLPNPAPLPGLGTDLIPAPVEGSFHWDQLRGYDTRLQAQVESAVHGGLAAAKTMGKLAAKDCRVAVVALDLIQRKQLVALSSKRVQRPASNQKILTIIAALSAWGSAGEFVTPVESHGTVRAGVLHGDLILRAGGDPVYDRDRESAMPAWAGDLAHILREADVEQIHGDLILDLGTYSDPAPAPAWPSQGERWQEYCALAGGFSANAGCLSAVLQSLPGMLRVRVLPPGHGLREDITVRKGPAGRALDVRVGVQGTKVIVGGTIPSGIPSWSTRFAHPNPVELFGGSVAFALGLHGIKLEGKVLIQRNTPRGKHLGVVSRPLRGQLEAVLLDSNNSVADQVFLTLGARSGDGSRGGAAQRVRKELLTLGIDPAPLTMVDGSGLSRDNRATTRIFAGVMAALWEKKPEAFKLFQQALPVAGQSGSLSRRMKSGPAKGVVAAKTGFIGGTSSLSGLVMEGGQPRLSFSILVEYPRKGGLNTSAWKPMQDEIAQALAAWVIAHPSSPKDH